MNPVYRRFAISYPLRFRRRGGHSFVTPGGLYRNQRMVQKPRRVFKRARYW